MKFGKVKKIKLNLKQKSKSIFLKIPKVGKSEKDKIYFHKRDFKSKFKI
jgi:hypothetical protein